LMAPNPGPESDFGVGWRPAQSSSDGRSHGTMFAFRGSRHYPPPYPPPQGGRVIPALQAWTVLHA
jgi:hypothetical protein